MKAKIVTHTPAHSAMRTMVALAALGFATSPFAVAQDEDDSVYELESFTVSGGFAGSLAASTEKKRYAPIIVEAVSAEDIGKLPDTSIAESLSRLPGLTSQRVNGRSQVISIRGFPADFSAGLLNGREIATTGSHRSVEFDQFPAELLSGAIVYKTADASLVEQGIGGTVDLRTVRPLAYGRRTLAFNTFYEWTELGALNAGSEDDGWRYSGTYIDQLNEGKMGIAFGYSHTSKPGQGEQWNAWGYPSGDTEEYGTVTVLGGAKPFVRSSLLERDSFMTVIENRPNKNIHSTIDVFFSDFQETQTLRGIEIPLFWSSASFRDGSERVEDGFVVEGIFDNIFGVVRNDVVFRDAEVSNIGWNLEIANLGEWTAEVDLSYSDVSRVDTVLETYSGTGSNQSGTPDTMRFSLEGGTGAVFTPTLDYTDTSLLRLSGPQGWGGDIISGGQVGYLKSPTSDDTIKQIRISANRRLSNPFLSRLTTGLSFKSREKSEFEAGNFLGLPDGQREAPFPASLGVTDLSFIGIPGMASYDPIEQLNNGTYRVVTNPNADVLSVDWIVEEEVSTAFAQFDIERNLGDMPVTGSIGLQYVRTEQSSTGLAASGTGENVQSLPVYDEHSYDDIVPSLNLTFALNQRDTVRFSAARQIMRQRMQDMRAGYQFKYEEARAFSTSIAESPWTGSGGNTQLEPWRANALDLSYEHYFDKGMGYWSAAVFYKDLKTFTFTEKQVTDFSGFPYTGTVAPVLTQGTLDVPQNGQGGAIKGLELTLSIPGERLADALSGFGAILSAAFTDSSVSPDPNDPNIPLQGFSEEVASATLYYEKRGFSARLSGRYRSDYRANIATFGPRAEDFRVVQPETLVDAQIGYTFQGGPLENMSIMLQGYNLNDEPLYTIEGADPRQIRDYQSYGRSYSVGLSYKF